VHCPFSNLRIGDGIARVPAMRRAGVRIGLGTDGRGCDETLDMLELTRMSALIHKARGLHYDAWPAAADVFDLTTRGGSRCAGHGDRLGRIEGPGADVLGGAVELDVRLTGGPQVPDPLDLAVRADDVAVSIDLGNGNGGTPRFAGRSATDGEQPVRAHRHVSPEQPSGERVREADDRWDAVERTSGGSVHGILGHVTGEYGRQEVDGP